MTKLQRQHTIWFALILFIVGCQSAPPTPVAPEASEANVANSQVPEVETGTPPPTFAFEITVIDPATATATSVPTDTPTPPPTATPTPTIPPAVIEVEGASLPPGFSLIKFADLFRPTGMVAGEDGRLYATSQDGTIHLFVDEDGDGRADVDSLFSFGFSFPLGINIGPDADTIYVSSNTKISILQDNDGDLVADEVTNLVRNLPVGLHQNDNPEFGPDGMLYIGIGSTCDACFEDDPRSATIMRFDPVTGQGAIYATGLRNPYDLAFHPITGDLFATDNGRDDLGMDTPFEELNLITQGSDYGWPGCWDEGVGPDCAGTETALAFFEPHSSANSIDFYTGDRFPSAYATDTEVATAYVAIFGSFLKPEVETGIARVRLIRSGESYQSEVSWFVQWPGGMPLGLVESPDGALYVGDYINDVIYRVSYGP
jgi:glucose/arabinose dehydrogenase